MSETSIGSPGGIGTGTGPSVAPHHGAAGERAQPGWRQGGGQSDQIGDFVVQQPMTAALIALVVGYFIGKLT